MADMTLSEAQTGTSVELRVGDRVIVALEETPTSGFRWEQDSLDEDILEVESSDFVPADSTELGGGGIRQLRLRVTRAGTAHIALKLWRAWEGEASVTRRFDAEVLARQ